MHRSKSIENSCIHGSKANSSASLWLEVLLALADAADYSLSAHVPRHAIQCRFARSQRGLIKRELGKIIKLGLASKHPTRGELTWQLTEVGFTLSKALRSVT